MKGEWGWGAAQPREPKEALIKVAQHPREAEQLAAIDLVAGRVGLLLLALPLVGEDQDMYIEASRATGKLDF